MSGRFSLDCSLICFVVVAGSVTMHCIAALERISPTGTPSGSYPSEPSISPSPHSSAWLRSRNNHPHKCLPDYASAFGLEISTGPTLENRDPFRVESKNVSHNDDFETFVGHRGDISHRVRLSPRGLFRVLLLSVPL